MIGKWQTGTILLSLILVSSGCEKNRGKGEKHADASGSIRETPIKGSSGKIIPATSADRNNSAQFRNPEEEGNYLKELLASSEDALLELCKSLVADHSVNPASREGERLQAALYALLQKNSKTFYLAVENLPPGYNSEMIVNGAISRHISSKDFSTDEILDLLAPIKESGFYRKGLEGAVMAKLAEIQRDGKPIDNVRKVVDALEGSRANEQALADILVYGVRKGELQLSDVVDSADDANSTNPRGNSVLLRAVTELPVEDAKQIVDQAILQGKALDPGSIQTVANRLVRKDPSDAMTWISGIPGKLGQLGVKTVMNEWMAADPLSATRYVGKMMAGEGKDTAVSSVVKNCIINKDYDAASQWLDVVSDQGLKKQLTTELEKNRN